NWGYNDAKKLLIFEGHWGSLAGLYLDGFGHREPLFDSVAVTPAPRPVVVTTPPTYVAQPVVRPEVVREATDVYAPRHDVVVEENRRYVHEDDYVVPQRTVIDDRVDLLRPYPDDHTVVVDEGYRHDHVIVV